jgi:hypothetical protein
MLWQVLAQILLWAGCVLETIGHFLGKLDTAAKSGAGVSLRRCVVAALASTTGDRARRAARAYRLWRLPQSRKAVHSTWCHWAFSGVAG